MPYANNNGADQPAHLRSLISAFVLCWIDSIICILAKSKNSKTLAFSRRFESYLEANPEDRFSHDVAHIMRDIKHVSNII